VAAGLAGLVVGVLIGLVIRPILDAYLAFKTAEMYRHDDVSQHSAVGERR
jgi:hypothetical protein